MFAGIPNSYSVGGTSTGPPRPLGFTNDIHVYNFYKWFVERVN